MPILQERTEGEKKAYREGFRAAMAIIEAELNKMSIAISLSELNPDDTTSK